MQVLHEGALLRRGGGGTPHVGFGSSGHQGVHPQSLGAVFCGQHVHQSHQSGLGSGVGGHARKTQPWTDEGRGEDQRGTSALQQFRNLMTGRQKGTRQVHVEGFLPAIDRDVGNAAQCAHGACVVEADVQSAEAFDGQGNSVSGAVLITYVAGQAGCLSTRLFDVVHQRRQSVLPTCHGHHGCSLAGKQLCTAVADSVTCAGDEGHFSFQYSHALLLLRCRPPRVWLLVGVDARRILGIAGRAGTPFLAQSLSRSAPRSAAPPRCRLRAGPPGRCARIRGQGCWRGRRGAGWRGAPGSCRAAPSRVLRGRAGR